jgi:hypothetical protein
MKGKIESLTDKLRKKSEELPDDAVQGILRVLESVEGQGLSCSEVYALLDQYVERELKDHEAAKVMPLLREHFDSCPDCCDEFEALLDAVERTPGNAETESSGPRPI